MQEECAVMFTLAMFEEIYFLVVRHKLKDYWNFKKHLLVS